MFAQTAYRITGLVIVSATLGIAFAQDQPTGSRRTPELSAAQHNRPVRELGARGSASRKESRLFSGTIEMPMGAIPEGLTGSAELKEPATSAAAIETAVTFREPRAAQFVTEAASVSASHERSTQSAKTQAVSDSRAVFTSPNYGSVLSPFQTFSWTAGQNVQEYYLWIGSCQDCKDILDENQGLSHSRTIGLPTDGRRLYVTLFSYINGAWYWVDYQFQASTQTGTLAQLTFPANGATLAPTQTFAWTQGWNVASYYLRVGTCQNCGDIWNFNEGLNLSRTLVLPQNNSTIFVTLFSQIAGSWYYYDYQFRGPGLPLIDLRVNLKNNLNYPINLIINGEVVGSVDPYSNQGINVRVPSLLVSFEVVQPVLSGKTLGDQFAGYFDKIDNPSGTYNFEVSNFVGQDYYFLPAITNRTPVPLEIEVNGGYTSENRCYCFAPAYSTNVLSGYYRLYTNSNVRLFREGSNYSGRYIFFGTDSDGQTSPGGALYRLIPIGNGFIELTANSAP